MMEEDPAIRDALIANGIDPDWDGDPSGDDTYTMKQPLMEIVDDPPQRGMIPRQGTSVIHCPGNIDSSTPRGKALLLKASGPGEYTLPESGVLKLRVTHWLILPDSQADEKTGEVREFCRTVLFDAAGKHFRTTAAHGPFRLRAMLDLYSPQEWAAGIPLVIMVRKSKRGTTYHDIQIDLESLE